MTAPYPGQSKIVIRQPREEDIERLLKIERRCFRAHRFTREDFNYHLSNPSSIFAAAADSVQAVGYVAGIVYHGPKHRIARLYSMAVLPASRKHGVGAELLKYFEREALKRKCEAVTLEVRKTNRTARSLYRRAGYEVEKTLTDYYAGGSDGIKMRKLLKKQ